MPTLHSAEPPELIDHALLFQSLSDAYIVFGIDDPKFTILEENEAHERIAFADHTKSIGKPVFDVFPDTSEEYVTTGKSQLLESIRKVIRTGMLDAMPLLKYDIPDKNGVFTQKMWSVTHHPIKDTNGKTIAVYQATEDITQHVETEKQLALTKYQLAQTLANGSIGTWVWNIKSELVFGDENLFHMYGLPSDMTEKGLPLDKFVEGIYEDDRARIGRAIEVAVKARSNFAQEYRTIDGDGSMRWVIARGRVETDENGELDRFPGVAIDITERKDAEQALSESENRLRFMADSMPQLIWITRPDGYHEYYNQRWYQYTGVESGSTDGDGWNDLFHPDDRQRAQKKWQHSLKTGEPYEIEYRLYHAPSGQYRWVIGRAMPFRDSDGRIVKWYGTCTDIHEQKRAAELESFLAEASKQLSASLDYKKTLQKISLLGVPSIADWCSVDFYDSTTNTFEQVSVAHADPSKISLAREHRKHNMPTIDGKTGVSKVIRTGQAEFYPHINDEMIKQAVNDPKTRKFMLGLHLHSIIIVPITIQDKTIGAISFVSTDSGRYYTEDDLHMARELATRASFAVANSQLYDNSIKELTERKRLEQELLLEKQKLESRVKERTEQLQLTNQGLREEIYKRHEVENALKKNSENLARSNQELQDFAYVASHDLQEPLRKIQAFGNLLENEFGEQLGEGSDYLARMRNAAARMSTLIEDLLAFSRVTTKAKPSVPVDLNQIVGEVLQDIESRIEETGGVVDVEELPTIKADPTHMRQLFQNLISNALKFHKPGQAPRVKINYIGDGPDYSEIHVSDNGIGFEEKYTDKIFAVFQRLHERDKYEGTGIGLAVVRKIVERYGGTITAKSAKNKGATFIIRLPKNGDDNHGKRRQKRNSNTDG